MARITEEEKARFHEILDDSIEKLNSHKNVSKSHWKHLSINFLKKRKLEEKEELKEALEKDFGDNEIKSECYDIINFGLFIVDNLNRKDVNRKERKRLIKKAAKQLAKL